MNEPVVTFDSVTFTYPDSDIPVFSELNLQLPKGVISFVGQNGTGKSTAMLLASGRLAPDAGVVSLFDTTTDTLCDEAKRNRYASFVYQNMEFDTDAPVAELFEFIYENGFHDSKDADFISDLTKTFELEASGRRKLQDLSKGEMQRSILAFSLLYGSKAIMMDEPIFALEDYQKQRALEFLTSYSHATGTPVYYSLHELELSKTYADYGLLFYRDRRAPLLAPVEEAFSNDRLEEAYEYPPAMLDHREHLFREMLVKISQQATGPI